MAERGGPAYVAIITDGNGRWAKARGLSVGGGHRAGAENVRARLRDAVELGIRELTVYAFSTENWSRSPAEVKYLIDLIAEYIDRVTPELHAENVCLRFIGERGDPVPPGLVKRMEWAEGLTAGNDRITLIVPFNYVKQKGPERLAELVPWAVYVTLTPFIGGDKAYAVATGADDDGEAAG
jgi:undecaprenyl diphosphate synthase